MQKAVQRTTFDKENADVAELVEETCLEGRRVRNGVKRDAKARGCDIPPG